MAQPKATGLKRRTFCWQTPLRATTNETGKR